MNAGKSTILLQSSYNYYERGMRTLLMKPVIDTRDENEDHINSRIGLKAKANCFHQHDNLEDYVVKAHQENPIDCVLLDEAQFLTTEQVWQLSRVADDHNIPVLCYGLRTDFRGDLFQGSAALLAISDDVKEIKTLCWCGRKATMNLRFDDAGHAVTDGEQVEIGGNERYISLCRKHWTGKQISKT